MTNPLSKMGLSSVHYMTEGTLGCLKFGFKNCSESNKYGNRWNIERIHQLREEPLVKITIYSNPNRIEGIKFTHKGGHTDELFGTFVN